MGIVNYAAEKKLLVVARGHPYDRDAIASALLNSRLRRDCWARNWRLITTPVCVTTCLESTLLLSPTRRGR